MAKEIIFGLLGGLGLFIYGMHRMSEGLHKISGQRMRTIMHSLTGGPKRGVLVGAGITCFIQSSSATTVMVIGFVNAGLMTLTQSLGVILGADIGTTITAQLIAFKLTDYALPIIGVGMIMSLLARRRVHKNIAEFLLGFGILFLGLSILTQVVKPLGGFPIFNEVMVNFSKNPLLGILAGTIVTAILQSSSVTIGMVLGLSMTGLIDLRAAIPIVLGCNIGTCITALIASIGTSIAAKRAAIAHITFKVVGVVIFLPFLGPFAELISLTSKDITREIANAHTLFNVINVLILIPFIPLFAKLLTKFVKGKEEEEEEYSPKYLDKYLLNTPPIAIEASVKEIVRTLDVAKKMVAIVMHGLRHNDLKILDKVTRREEAVDSLREAITEYLVKLMQQELGADESKKIPSLIHAINDVERIGDHADNLRNLIEQKIDSRLSFSSIALEEIERMYGGINNMIDCSMKALQTNDMNEARFIMAEECQINVMRDRFKSNHIKRLEESKCNVISGVVFLDIISNFEKIGDHLNNVAQAITEGLQW
ncbi:MAG: Na/Pi cotransporter family protein [Candidatus Omnitrophica bacterium]|nr:Na/Pi cotransporter family protein [Candidatus Omnitrophota bacterium]